MNEISSSVSENSGTEKLSLKQVAELLEARGVEVSYSALSELVNAGDIATQLGVNGGGNRRAFPPAAVDVLAAFLPQYREGRGRIVQAPALLRAFLTKTQALTVPVRQIGETAELLVDPIAVARAQGWTQGLERSMTAKEAAEYLQIGVRTLRKSIKPYRRYGNSPDGDRWLLSDLLKSEEN
jgi:hypothetical protein